MRFARQELLAQMGRRGQRSLAESKVLVVGVGGLGCPAALYLSSMGVGSITLVDGDRVEETNLHRQPLFSAADIGRNKAEAAVDRLRHAYPDTAYRVHPEFLSTANAEALVDEHDITIDGTDSYSAKFLINDASLRAGRPFVWGVAVRLEGRLAVFWPGQGPCYRCYQPHPPRVATESCNEVGVLGAVPGLIGTWQALEAVKTLVRTKDTGSPMGPEPGLMLSIDFENLSIFRTRISKSPQCESSHVPAAGPLHEEFDAARCNAVTECDWSEVRLNSWTLIDVREVSEMENSPAPLACLRLPLSRIEANPTRALESLPHSGETTPIALFCQSGLRSRNAAALLKTAAPACEFYSVRGGIQTRSSARQ